MKIVYYSGTGNTEKMAKLIGEGVQLSGSDVELVEVSNITKEELLKEEVLILGSPACGVESIEETVMEPLIDSLEGEINGKKVALFGSYSWGQGEWMEDWEDKMKSYGADIIVNSLILLEDPFGNEDECREFGKAIIESLK